MGLGRPGRARIASIASVLLLGLAAPLRAQQVLQALQAQPANYRIVVDAPQELVDELRTQTLLGRWRTDPSFEPDQMPLFVARAREEAEAIARAAGFFSAQATVTQAEGADGLPEVRIAVDAGARTTVASMALVVEGEAADTAVEALLDEAWPLEEGSFFRVGEWELGKRQLIEQLQQRGYLRARIADSRAEVDPETTAATLRVTVDSGPRLAFGELTVLGLERYPRSIIDDLRTWRDGDPYGFDRILLFQERLRADGYFGTVSVLPDLEALESDPQRDTVPVIASVRERQAQRVTTGVGFSTDQGARALLGYQHRNVLGRGWIVDSGALLEQVRHRIYVDGRTPWDAAGKRWHTGVRSERFDVTGELTEKDTVYFGRGARRGDTEYYVSLQYQDETSTVAVGGGQDPVVSYNKALTLGYAWARRRLDSRLDPRSGYTVSAQVSGAVKGFGSDATFARAYGRAMHFWPMPSDSILAGGALVGLVEAGMVVADGREGIPSENLFRAGGAQSIRGYDYLTLGVPQGEAVVGGRVLALASLEYQHPIVGNWYGAGFVDIGNAADRWTDWDPVRGTGVGLRWRSPIGPVNLDAAYADRDRSWRLHFSVGYSF
ncbi:MAG TPA: autotransporter assembly complex family protein [Quisquiliibacterium sp.]|nr:autotransporter assembly complex family protein [Quisquiliibacterium sp.]